jgi:hypothetical protein
MRITAIGAFILIVLFAFGTAIAAPPLTLTGCLEKGHEEGEFRLTNASGGDAKQYELVTGKGVDLKAHMGHKVEVTTEPASDVEHKGAKEKEAGHPHFRVTALKHIAAKCP